MATVSLGGLGQGSRRSLVSRAQTLSGSQMPSLFCLCELSHTLKALSPNNRVQVIIPAADEETEAHRDPCARAESLEWGGVGESQGQLCTLGRGVSLQATTDWCPRNPSALDLLGLPHTWLLGPSRALSVGPQVRTDGLGRPGSSWVRRLAAPGNGVCLMGSEEGLPPCTAEAPHHPWLKCPLRACGSHRPLRGFLMCS